MVRLGCVGCGASLEIGQEVNQVACIHCGTSQMVQRDGGGIHLKEVAHTLSRVQAGTDKTAAELAIARLTKDRDELIVRLRNEEHSHHQHRAQREHAWSVRIADKARTVNIIAVLGGIFGGLIIGGFLSGILGGIASAIAGRFVDISGVRVIVTVISMVLAGFGVRMLSQQADFFNLSKLRKNRDEEFDRMDSKLNATRISINDKVRGLNLHIEKNRRIADS